MSSEYLELDFIRDTKTWLDTVLPPPLICVLFFIVAFFAKWEYIYRLVVALGLCFGCMGVGLVFEW
jgi:hypothetical protein